MIDKFSTVYAGHVDLGDMGQQATPANERRYSNDHLASVFAKTEAIARCMDEHGYQDALAGRASLPARGLRVHSEHHDGRRAPGAPHHSACASAAASTSRPCGIRSGSRRTSPPRISSPGGASSSAWAAATTPARSRPSAPRCSTPRPIATLFEEQVDIVMKAFRSESFSHQGKHYTLPPAVPYRGYELKEITLVPRPHPPAGRVLAADRERGRPRARLHDQAPHQGLIGGGAATMAEKSIYAYQEAAQRADSTTRSARA